MESNGTIYHGGRIRTLVQAHPEPDAVGIESGNIVAMGPLAQVRAALPEAADVDLSGDCIIPGFIDVHHHFVLSALLANLPDAAEARSVSEVLAQLTEAKAEDGQWTVVANVNPNHLAEDRYPSLEELDGIDPKRPLCVLGFSLHEAAVNSAGLAKLGGEGAWSEQFKAVLKTRAGRITGEVREQPVARVLADLVQSRLDTDRSGAIVALQDYAKRLAQHGITHVLDPGLGPAEESLLLDAKAAGLAVHVDYMLASADGLFSKPADRLADRARSRHIKVFVDGGAMVAMSWSAWEIMRYSLGLPLLAMRQRSLRLVKRALKEDVLPGPGGRYHSGIKNYSAESLNELCRDAMDRGFSIAMHASGTEAIEMGLGALEQRGSDRPEVPDQLIHFLFPRAAHIARAAELGAAVVLQPAMVESYAHEVHHTVPAGDFELSPPLGEMLDRNVRMVLSSDAPIAEWRPLSILAAAVAPTRGVGLTRARALEQMTSVAAEVLGRPEVGTLQVGGPAHLVRLTADPALDGVDLASIQIREATGS